MATAAKVMSIAESYIGTVESPANSNNVLFNTDYYGKPVSGSDYPWCCAFIWDIYRMANASQLFYGGLRTAACATYESWALRSNMNVSKTEGKYGDVVTFDFGNRGYAHHIGFIKSRNADGTYQTIEGNTSANGSQDNGGAVLERRRSTDSIRYIFRPAYDKETKVITQLDLRKAVNSVCSKAKAQGWTYGDSHGLPKDTHVTSCDRTIFQGLYDLGYHDQKIGLETVITMNDWLIKHGFTKIVNRSQLTHGDIILMADNASPKTPTAAWHTYLCDVFRSVSSIDKYDTGSQTRILNGGYTKGCPVSEWPTKSFYAGYRVPMADGDIPTGYYKIVSALGDDWVMDVENASKEKKANIQLWKANGTEAQIFHVHNIGDGRYAFTNVNSRMKFDIAGGSTEKGANLQQYKDNSSRAQRFFVQKSARDGYYTIINRGSGLVLDAAGGVAKKGINIRQWSLNNTKAQQWKFEKVEV